MPFTIPDCNILRVRRKMGAITAIRVQSPFFLEFDEWIPWSVVHDDSDIYREGEQGDLMVEDWFAEKQGWT